MGSCEAGGNCPVVSESTGELVEQLLMGVQSWGLGTCRAISGLPSILITGVNLDYIEREVADHG